MKRLPEKHRTRGLWIYFASRPSLSTEVLFLFPLALLYHLGTLFNGRLNGVDLVSMGLILLDRHWPEVTLGLEIAVLVGFMGLWWWARSRQEFAWRNIGPVLAEAGLYAVSLGSLVVFLLVKVFHMEPPVMAGGVGSRGGWLDVVQVSAGAGLYEELVFRLILFGGLVKLLVGKANWSKSGAMFTALAVSSLLFSAAHHWPGGEPFEVWAFAYRTLTGMLLGLIYWYRGLSVAAYTHAFYDVMVLGSAL